jgi:enoyl-CoA hydratase
MTFKTLQFESQTSNRGHSIGIVRVNRPESLNALNHQVILDLTSLVTELENNAQIRTIILTGSGEKAFVAGADIKEMEKLGAREAHDLSFRGQSLLSRIENLRMPVIAAVNGFALGGGLELALACDFIVASKQCKWGLPEVTLGLIPGYGGTQRLVRSIGRARARRVALSGEIFSAQQGYEWGVFAHLTEPQDLMKECLTIAETLATRAPRSLAWVKDAINQGGDLTQIEGLKLETDLFTRAFETQDHHEGIQAFINKRPPQFQGR